jgi:hypothetical protein
MMDAAPSSYCALRVSLHSTASDWWSAASDRRDAPQAIGALLRGRNRVELTREEATDALAWAGSIAGWAAAEPKPLFMHVPDHGSAAGGQGL